MAFVRFYIQTPDVRWSQYASIEFSSESILSLAIVVFWFTRIRIYEIRPKALDHDPMTNDFGRRVELFGMNTKQNKKPETSEINYKQIKW